MSSNVSNLLFYFKRKYVTQNKFIYLVSKKNCANNFLIKKLGTECSDSSKRGNEKY